jgi:hypothetical protein
VANRDKVDMKTFSRKQFLGLLSFTCLGAMTAPASARSLRFRRNWRFQLQQARLERAQISGGLAIYPISGNQLQLPEHLTLDSAFRQGELEVSETNEGGEVNRLRIHNSAERPVFICAGEILVGAKQDRVLRRDLWLPADSESVIVDAFCVERDRWGYRHDRKHFSSEGGFSNGAVRAAANSAGSQAEVWDRVEETFKSSGVQNRSTQSLQTAYSDSQTSGLISSRTRLLRDLPDRFPEMIGAVVQVGNRLHLMDVFPDPELLRLLWPKLIKSYALESLSYGRKTASSSSKLSGLLQTCSSLNERHVDTPGEGELLVLSSSQNSIHGEALEIGSKLAHLQLFFRSGYHVKSTPEDNNWPSAQELIRPKQ